MSKESSAFPSPLSRWEHAPDSVWRAPASSPAQLDALLSLSWDAKLRQQIESLQREPNPELQSLGLLQIARVLAVAGEAEPSARLLNFLKNHLSERQEPWAVSMRKESAALEASLSSGGKVREVTLSYWLRAATDVSTLAAFSLGGALGEFSEIVSLGRLRAAAPSVWTRGPVADLLSKTAAVSVEAPAIWGLKRQIAGWQGREDTSDSHSLKCLALNLAMLRGFGAWASAHPKLAATPGIVTAAPLLGASFARYLSGVFGWQRRVDALSATRESLEFLLASGLGARVSRGLFGESLASLRSRVETRPAGTNPSHHGLAGFEEALPASLPSRWDGKLFSKPIAPDHVQMALSLGASGSGRGFVLRRLAQRLRNELGPRLKLPPASLQRIVSAFQNTPLASDEAVQRYGNLLLGTKIESGLSEEGMVERQEILERAMQSFSFVSRLDPLRRTTGSYYEHLLQAAFRQSLEQANQEKFDELLRAAGLSRKAEILEAYLEVPKPRLGSLNPSQLERLAKLPIAAPAKVDPKPVLQNYLGLQLGSGPQSADPARERDLIKISLDGAEVIVPWSVENALAGLELYCLQHPASSAAQGQLLEGIKAAIGKPQGGYFLLDRLLKLVYLQPGREKMFELADWPKAKDLPRLNKQITLDTLTSNFSPTAEAINGTVHTAFINDLPLAEKIVRIWTLATIHRDPKRSQDYRKDTVARAAVLLGERERALASNGIEIGEANFGSEEVLEMLYLHPTKLATAAREAISHHEVDLEVASPARQKELWTRIDHSGKYDQAPPGFYVPQNLSPSGKPLIVIRQLDPEASRQDKINRAVWLAANVVHEFEHHMHRAELDLNDPRQATIAEMRAQAETLFYHLRQGNEAEWDQMLRLSPYGFGFYLRNNAELEIFPSTHLVVGEDSFP